MVPLQNKRRCGRRARLLNGDSEGRKPERAFQWPGKRMTQTGGRRLDQQPARRGSRLGMTCDAEQKGGRGRDCRTALQAAGFIKPERLRIATQLDKHPRKRAGPRRLLGHPQHIIGVWDDSLEHLARPDMKQRGKPRQIGHARLTGRLRAGNPQKRGLAGQGPAHQGERKAGKARGMARLTGAQFRQRRTRQPAAKRSIKGIKAGTDQPVTGHAVRQTNRRRMIMHQCQPWRLPNPAGRPARLQPLRRPAFHLGDLAAKFGKPLPPRRTAVPGFHNALHAGVVTPSA